MKKIISLVMCAILGMFAGCKTVPTADKMYSASYAIGASTGIILNMTNIPGDKRNVIIDIINEVKYCVPETNQTIKSVWVPIAQAHVDKLVDEGKLDKMSSSLIMTSFNVVCDGIDYIFDHRYPEARKYKDLIESSVHGFIDGLLTVYKPENSLSSFSIDYDTDAFNYLMNIK